MFRSGILSIGRKLSSASQEGTVHVSRACADRIGELNRTRLSKTGEAAEHFLRVEVTGGGCAGFQYNFTVTPERRPDDVIVTSENSAKVVMDPISFTFLKGAEIDYSQEMIRSSFRVVKNPNAVAGCGCGSSFEPKPRSVAASSKQ